MTTRLRLQRAERLLKVQEQMRAIAERDLAQTRAKAAKVEADRAAMLATLSGETLHGLFLEAAARRLRTLAGEAGELATTATRQAGTVRERGLATMRAERQAEGLAKRHAHEREKADLRDQLDLMAARASMPTD